MVYRGKPSAGCDNCRKAKKRCTLEQPSCSRCVKLKKECAGYRDTSVLQIHDESESVRRKATKTKSRSAIASAALTPPAIAIENSCTSLPDLIAMMEMDLSTIPLVSMSDVPIDESDLDCDELELQTSGNTLALLKPASAIPYQMKPVADDVATTHFFNSFTNNGHWDFLRVFQRKSNLDPCLNLAIRACGMAALTNIEYISKGPEYARSMYVEALGLLNAALRDPKRSTTDESLLAVTMLGYYENLVCDSRENILSWKAHISGATSLLHLRGTSQFSSLVGRTLFRETRAQILIHCIWDDLQPPSFLWDWQAELERQSPEMTIARPADTLTSICFEFAMVRAKIEQNIISNADALAECNDIDRKMLQWSMDTSEAGERWQWNEVEVPDSPDVWNGLVHSFAGPPAPAIWNTFRSIRILVTRSQEWLCKRFEFSPADREEQTSYFRKVRRQMTDEICAGIPCQLGHRISPGQTSSSALMSAYASIWPLFFAGTCALERIGQTRWESFTDRPDSVTHPGSAASAQAAWLLSRLDYIADHIGLRWASGIAAALRGDFTMHTDLHPEDIEAPAWLRRRREGEIARAMGDKGLLEAEARREGNGRASQEVERRLSKRDRLDHAGLLFEDLLDSQVQTAELGGMWSLQPDAELCEQSVSEDWM
ncbi:hypothetical protein LTR62_001448 [Meristemomyces frigidus]|uniref:Zn(2)-C6 fungal-type domain-containing protein n=1 Tax=Meristemomyces frigidus TaxID=1508187 RepID=A0AAN7YI58_9PEZI|nr:hypothetical protein LTR62_001448 [Meristemomyces frigidus]